MLLRDVSQHEDAQSEELDYQTEFMLLVALPCL